MDSKHEFMTSNEAMSSETVTQLYKERQANEFEIQLYDFIMLADECIDAT